LHSVFWSKFREFVYNSAGAMKTNYFDLGEVCLLTHLSIVLQNVLPA